MLLRGECSNVRRTALLKDLPPIHRWQPQTTPPEVVERILALAIEHPAYGCNRVEALLMLEGKRVSAITVQKILSEHALATRHNQRIMGAVAREDEAMAKARDEAVDPFHGLPIPQTLASKISSSAIERDAVALVASWRRWLPPEARFVADSPVEGNGFEPSVPGR